MNKSYYFSLLILLFFCSIRANQPGHPVITPYEERDLQLFTTYQHKPGLLSSIDRTVTKIGHEYLQEQLATPLVRIPQLYNRQNIIKELLLNTSAQETLCAKLKEFAQYEKSLLALAIPNPIAQSAIEQFYFQNKYLEWLNTFPAGLEAGRVLHIANLSAPLLEHAIIHFLISEKLHDYLGIRCGHDHGAPAVNIPGHTHASSTQLFAYNTYNIIHTLIHVAGIKGLFDHVQQQSDILKSMQQGLMDINKCVRGAYSIYKALQEYPELNQQLTGHDELASLFSDDSAIPLSADLHEFLLLITKNTFLGSPSFFSRSGNILRAYALAKKVQPELQKKFSAIATLDFHLACAMLYQEYSRAGRPCSFAHYHVEETPSLKIQGFWNPLVAEMQAINQWIALGNQEPAIAVVTGPNKAGKSTSLSALCIAVVLAQTLTIVPAHECHITPFTCIRTGFNMTSRVNEEQSLFSASLDFANELVDHAQAHKNQFVFVAVDELFNSTDFAKGSHIAYRFAQALGNCKNCIALLATHFACLTQLEKEDPACFKNFKAELSTQENDTRYLLEPGTSESENVLRLIDIKDNFFE